MRENEISQKMMSFNKAASSLEEKVAWLSQQECPRNLKFLPSYKLELYHVGRRKFSSLQYSQYVQLLQVQCQIFSKEMRQLHVYLYPT